MGHYNVECPFCGVVHELIDSEYPYTETGCECGAKFKCDNYEEQVEVITQIPRTAYEFELSAEEEFDFDEFESLDKALDEFIERISEKPAHFLNVKRSKKAVSEDTVHEVLQEGIHGDGIPISSSSISASEVRSYNVRID